MGVGLGEAGVEMCIRDRNDTDAGLRLLEKTLPVRIQRMTPYWVTVAAR